MSYGELSNGGGELHTGCSAVEGPAYDSQTSWALVTNLDPCTPKSHPPAPLSWHTVWCSLQYLANRKMPNGNETASKHPQTPLVSAQPAFLRQGGRLIADAPLSAHASAGAWRLRGWGE